MAGASAADADEAALPKGLPAGARERMTSFYDGLPAGWTRAGETYRHGRRLFARLERAGGRSMRFVDAGSHQIATDGQTVWVNGPTGTAAGRYRDGGDGRRGVFDVHDAAGSCLHCKSWEGPGDWELFREKMREAHGVEVPESARPRVRPEAGA